MAKSKSKKQKSRKPKYSAAERRAYWIGVGRSFAAGDTNAKLSEKSFANNLSAKEDKSYQQGLMATVYNPKIFEKSKKR